MFHRLDALRRQFDEAKTAISTIEQAAAARGNDLTDAEQADVDKLVTRCEELSAEIEPLAKRAQSIQATADVLARIPSAGPALITRSTGPASPAKMSAGEYLSAFYRATQGDAEAQQLLTRAIDTQTTAENAGIIPVPIVGELIKFADDTRPVFGSFTSRPMPQQGKTFNRPRVTQRVNVAKQNAELDELASRNMAITGDAVSKATYAGVLRLSEQDIDWTDPALLDIVLADFIGMYANSTEAAACAALVATATAESTWTATNIGDVVDSIMAGVLAVYATAKRIPDTLWWSLDELLGIAGMTNTDNTVTALTLLRRALDDAGLKLNFVTGPQLASGTKVLGCSSLVESYEQQKGFITAANVSNLGADIAYRGYVAFYGRAEGFVSLVEAP